MGLGKTTSYSEISTWAQCRMKHHWQYTRLLETKKISPLPSIGSCGHEALSTYMKGGDWRQSVKDWVKRSTAPLWENTTPPATEEDEFDYGSEQNKETINMFEDAGALIEQIMARYTEKWDQDNFTVVATEQHFAVPIVGMRTKLIGYWDAIVMDENENLWLMETKFPGEQFYPDDGLDLDMQVGIYQYAAVRLGYPIIGTIYNQALQKFPKVPERNKDGKMSRGSITTDWPTYRAALIAAGLNPADYLDMMDKLKDKEFFRRTYIYRSGLEVKRYVKDIQHAIWDMSSNKHVYMCGDRIRCQRCQFRELCIETLKGGDVDFLVQNAYQPRIRREEITPEEI